MLLWSILWACRGAPDGEAGPTMVSEGQDPAETGAPSDSGTVPLTDSAPETGSGVGPTAATASTADTGTPTTVPSDVSSVVASVSIEASCSYTYGCEYDFVPVGQDVQVTAYGSEQDGFSIETVQLIDGGVGTLVGTGLDDLAAYATALGTEELLDVYGCPGCGGAGGGITTLTLVRDGVTTTHVFDGTMDRYGAPQALLDLHELFGEVLSATMSCTDEARYQPHEGCVPEPSGFP